MICIYCGTHRSQCDHSHHDAPDPLPSGDDWGFIVHKIQEATDTLVACQDMRTLEDLATEVLYHLQAHYCDMITPEGPASYNLIQAAENCVLSSQGLRRDGAANYKQYAISKLERAQRKLARGKDQMENNSVMFNGKPRTD